MRRKSFDALASAGGVLLTVVLVVAGVLLFWGYSYANNSVSSQLAAQKITFPTRAELATATNPPPGGFSEITPAMVPYLEPYAGQEMTTGAQAEVYANQFINRHLEMIGDGKTYAQVSAAAMALPPGTAAYNAAEAKVTTIFQGTTLRGMLLNAYGWWQMGQIALLSSIASFAFAVIAALLSVLGIRHFRRVPDDEEIPRLRTTQPLLAAGATAGARANQVPVSV
jgi:hypothetical protein